LEKYFSPKIANIAQMNADTACDLSVIEEFTNCCVPNRHSNPINLVLVNKVKMLTTSALL